ncbi:sigma-70 family RNA polymerase sigma factor (plasmid) [Streptomyces yangpuensis]|uniref:Sigma-70 family RNA polymerase sigma factor n=1 Tax=Streptomyces yangpuensis TaxID=1648182 RepID=A0ABY5Q8Z8_9ACTN|nr:sigma-70 family RNA polymerase sigma factor [Streptomyces yangpuensis]UUY52660.1 sigma-70 family RNA polymerase sigma factor [Streptomyces yangpuensis]
MSRPGTARQQDLRALSDGELCALLRGHTSDSGTAVREVMDEVFARHHPSVLAYARTCCRDLSTAQDLAAEAFARTYRAIAWGAGPEYAWRPYLLTCVRRLAAAWTREASRTRLSDDFEEWVEQLSDGADAEDAVFSAEEESLVLHAYRSLPERWQAVLWHSVVENEPAAETAARLGISAGGVGSLAARAREGLREAYLRAHLDRSASDECKHYGGQIAARLRRPGTRLTRDLGRHLQGCAGCARAERDLRDVNGRLGVLLLGGILLWNPASFLSALGGGGTQLAASGVLGGTQLAGAKAGAVKWAAAAAVAGTAATVVVLLPSDSEGRGSGRVAAPVSTFALPRGPLPEATPISVIGSAAHATAPATPPPSPSVSVTASASAVPPSPSPSTDRTGAGSALVNVASGLCVGVGDGSSGGDPVQLEPCTGKAGQKWERLPAHQNNTYQLRNAGTGTCLDGTAGGGNVVGVTLRACRAGGDRVTQLWRFERDRYPGAYRVWFVPRVPDSDYADHLLGPRNWPKSDPPRPGSEIAHLPNYYNSVNLLFALR